MAGSLHWPGREIKNRLTWRLLGMCKYTFRFYFQFRRVCPYHLCKKCQIYDYSCKCRQELLFQEYLIHVNHYSFNSPFVCVEREVYIQYMYSFNHCVLFYSYTCIICLYGIFHSFYNSLWPCFVIFSLLFLLKWVHLQVQSK